MWGAVPRALGIRKSSSRSPPRISAACPRPGLCGLFMGLCLPLFSLQAPLKLAHGPFALKSWDVFVEPPPPESSFYEVPKEAQKERHTILELPVGQIKPPWRHNGARTWVRKLAATTWRSIYLHFTDEKTEAWRAEVCLTSSRLTRPQSPDSFRFTVCTCQVKSL